MGDQAENYYYDSESDNLVLEITKKGTDIQSYHYNKWDPNGHVVGMVVKDKDSSGNWKTTPYYFLTDQHGDVIQIVNEAGDKVGSYTTLTATCLVRTEKSPEIMLYAMPGTITTQKHSTII